MPETAPPSPPQPATSPELKFATSLPAAILLSLAGGCIEAFVYLNHGHVFAAVMTGNTVLFGAGLLRHQWSRSLHDLVPILAFPFGLFCSRVLQFAASRRYVTLGLLTEILGLLIASFLPGGFPDAGFVALVAFFAAFQVSSFRKEDGLTYNSTFITSDLRTVVDGLSDLLHPSKRAEGLRKARQLGLILLSFFSGAVVAAFLAPRIFNHTLWFADLTLLLVLLFVLIRSRAAAFR